MTLDLSHLAGAAREQVFQDAKARIRIVRTARWVGFSRAQLAVEELERRYDFPTCARMPCLLLYGDSGMGKTMILEKMERQHPSTHDERRGITMRPVLTVQMPPSPDERRFYTRILEVLGAPYSIRDQIGSLEAESSTFFRSLVLNCCLSTKSIICWQVVSANNGGRSISSNSCPMSSKSSWSWSEPPMRFMLCRLISRWRAALSPYSFLAGRQRTHSGHLS